MKTAPSINLKPLPGALGVEVTGVDVSAGVDARRMREMALAFIEHKVLLLRNQKPSSEAYASFAREWGTPRIDGFTELNLPGFDDLSRIGNTGGMLEQDEYRNGASFWHTDCAAEPDPNATTMLYCIRAPANGGETVIADMQAAYEALDEGTQKEIDPLTAHHCYSGTQDVIGGREDWEYSVQPVTDETASQIPAGATRPLVRAHSVTGRKGLYSPAGSIVAIDDLETAAAHQLVRRLKLHAINERFCYRHRYRSGDILMWDNSATLHYATPVSPATTPDQHRLLYRIVPLGLPRALNAESFARQIPEQK